MYIRAAELLPFIPLRPRNETPGALKPFIAPVVLNVRHPNDELAFTVDPREAQVLANMGWVEGHIYKKELTWLRLLVHAGRARKLLHSPLQAQTAKGITARKQSNGAKHWVTRLDRAECGIGGGSSRVVFPMSIPHYRLGTGKTDKPASQVA